MVRLSDAPAIIKFGRFRIFPHRRQLLADGRPIRLGGRAFDVLMRLIEASGRWPDDIVTFGDCLDDRCMAFAGDCLLVRGSGRTDFPEGDPGTMYRSVRQLG